MTAMGPLHNGQSQGKKPCLLLWGDRRRGRNWRNGGERLLADRQQCAATAAGKETKMPDAHEPPRQQMEQEAVQELIDREG